MKCAVAGVIYFLLFCISTGAFALRDPTRPPYYQDPSTGRSTSRQHVLSAIIINHARRLAMVDGKLVREGQKIGDSQVALIGADIVQLETPSGRISLFLRGASVRGPVTAPGTMDRQGSRE